MVNEINIINIASGNSLKIGEGVGISYVLDYIDWDTPSVNLEGYRLPKQIGRTITGAMVGSRRPTVYGYVIADMSNEDTVGMNLKDYYRLQEEKIEQNKLVLDRLISPFQDVEIRAGGFVLKARPEAPVKYSATEDKNNEVFCAFVLSFECAEPLFTKGKKTIELATIDPLFHFPYDNVKKDKIVFGLIKQKQTMLVKNEGDVPVPCLIKVEAKGGKVADPKILDSNGNFIAFDNVELQDGDCILINSKKGEEDARKYEARTGKNYSVIGNRAKGARFLNVGQGSNFYSYEVAEQYKNNVAITLDFEEQFFNIRGM